MTARALNITVALAVAAGLAALLIFVPLASAAEPPPRNTDRTAGQWEIWAYRAHGLLRTDEPNMKRIRREDDAPYASKVECDDAIKGVRVDVLLRGESGWKLKCDGVETWRVR